jgi:hypothetical protein
MMHRKPIATAIKARSMEASLSLCLLSSLELIVIYPLRFETPSFSSRIARARHPRRVFTARAIWK